MSVTVQLGGFVFQDFEVPEAMPWGGEQLLAIHRLVGGQKVIDAMGRDESPMTWSGRFRGSDATSRARQVDAMRVAGKALSLTWDAFSYTVVIKSFQPVYAQNFEIPYTITCEVGSDDAQPVAPGQGPSVDDMMAADSLSASDLSAEIGDAGLTTLTGNVQTSVAAVPSFASATRDVLNTVLTPIQAVQGYLGGLINSVEGVIGASPSFGGVVAGDPAASSAASLVGQVAAMTQAPMLYDLQSLMGRMTTNLAAVRASGSTQVVAGGDLYHLAASAYGDASEWPVLALANGLTDPILTGVQTILIPPTGQGVDGVLQP